MIPTLFSRRRHRLTLAAFLSGLSACSTVPETSSSKFDAAAVNGVSFRFAQTRVFDTTVPASDITRQIASNLGAWGYDIDTDNTQNFSHTMTVTIGEIKRDTTPQGLSFSAGNSDPRAMDFQKADILPVRCALSRKDQTEPSAELSMHASADDYEQLAGKTELIALLVDDMSTACFNLLEQLQVKTRMHEPADTATMPGWVPEIRIETETDNAPSKAVSSQSIPSPAQNLEPPADSELSQTEQKKPPRKRMIIHNQGSPVTFTFGHERK